MYNVIGMHCSMYRIIYIYDYTHTCIHIWSTTTTEKTATSPRGGRAVGLHRQEHRGQHRARGARKGTNGVGTNGVTANSMFVWQRDFLGTPVNLLLPSQKCQHVPFSPNLSKCPLLVCSGPISVDPICPQPRQQAYPLVEIKQVVPCRQAPLVLTQFVHKQCMYSLFTIN